jgi:hypothetical protein
MPTNVSGGSYISRIGVYRIYRKLAKECKILKGSIAWGRMEKIYDSMSKKEKAKISPLKESDVNEEVIK